MVATPITGAGPAGGAARRAYARIKADIHSGALPPGERLKEELLAERIGVSRTPVREALRRLGTEGLVDFEPNQGAVVAAWSLRDIEEIFDLRAVLESHGMRLSATRIADSAIDELESLADGMERAVAGGRGADAVERISRLNDRFHKIILEAAGNRRLVRLLASIVEMPVVLRTFALYSDGQLRRSFDHHREMIAALRARDPDWAAAVMASHVRAARTAYAAAFAGADGGGQNGGEDSGAVKGAAGSGGNGG